jgi:hypothetical protein
LIHTQSALLLYSLKKTFNHWEHEIILGPDKSSGSINPIKPHPDGKVQEEIGDREQGINPFLSIKHSELLITTSCRKLHSSLTLFGLHHEVPCPVVPRVNLPKIE